MFAFKVKPIGNFENPNLDSAVVKLYSKNGHSALIQPSDLEGRTSINTGQKGSCLNIEAKAGSNPANDALVVEVSNHFVFLNFAPTVMENEYGPHCQNFITIIYSKKIIYL